MHKEGGGGEGGAVSLLHREPIAELDPRTLGSEGRHLNTESPRRSKLLRNLKEEMKEDIHNHHSCIKYLHMPNLNILLWTFSSILLLPSFILKITGAKECASQGSKRKYIQERTIEICIRFPCIFGQIPFHISTGQSLGENS